MKLLKFYAEWCQPCKQLTQWLEDKKLPYEVEAVDIDANQELLKKYDLRGIPTVILVDDNGEKVAAATSLPTIKIFLEDMIEQGE